MKGYPEEKTILLLIIIHSKYLFGLSYMTGTIAGAVDTAVNKNHSCLVELTFY